MGSTAPDDQEPCLALTRPTLVPRPRVTRARARRTTESVLLQEIGSYLPISQRTLRSLDKISILRLAVTQLKLRQLFGADKIRTRSSSATQDHALGELIVGGFLIVISVAGHVVYVSEAITECLGLRSCEVMGKNIYDYALLEDHTDVDQLLAFEYDGGGASTTNYPSPRTGLIRLKSAIRAADNPFYFRPASNKVIYLSGKLSLNSPIGTATDFLTDPASGIIGGCRNPCVWPCFIGVGHPIPHPADHDYPYPTLASRTFMSFCSSTNLAFLQVDKELERLLGFTYREPMSTKKCLDLIHDEDVPAMMPRFNSRKSRTWMANSEPISKFNLLLECLVLKQGQTQFEPYRFLVKGGGWVWMIAEASIVYRNSYRADTQRSSQAAHVVCRYIALSEVQTSEIVSVAQLPAAENTPGGAGSCACDECRSGSGSNSTSLRPPARPAGSKADAELFQELFQSGSASDSSPGVSVDWDDSIEEFSKYVPGTSEPLEFSFL